MDWNKAVVIAAQCVVFVTMAVLVALGHDSTINDFMLAAGGAITGVGAYHVAAGVAARNAAKDTTDTTK